ncbi:MAG: ABC transporter permease subunit [Candidatus Poribacteria bacterium]|nr:ABC transporter permease subunit [Candidatus Poribacteria bacterium]
MVAPLFTVPSFVNGDAPEVKVGSKKFTESVILGELISQIAQSAGASAVHRRELGGTRILWNALLKGEIDAYPEYTGTISQEILAGEGISGEEEIRKALAAQGIRMSRPLGFNNTYIVGMKEAVAEKLLIRTISDLRRHPDLKIGFSNEFMDRGDGWPSLRDRYSLPHRDVRGMDHDLAYRGLERGDIQVIDLYSTDAEIQYYNLRGLADDLGHFPAYHAVILYRDDLQKKAPKVASALLKLEGRIPEKEMVKLNARVKLDRVPESRVASEFLEATLSVKTDVQAETGASRFLKHTREHLLLVAISLLGAIIVSIPLGILAAKVPQIGQIILGIVGIIQTIPSLALLVFMIPLLGIGGPPAILALFLYSLLPIVRNTYAGLHDIPMQIRESAEALGLPPAARLRLVELPMSARSILAGIKTAAVINVGTATLGALIGAGGYGQPILTGIRLDDVGLILQGAVPAAGLALLVQGLFELAERGLVSKGLRLKAE